MLLYYITDRRRSKAPLPELVGKAIRAGVDLVQIREKDLRGGDLYELCAQAGQAAGGGARILVNSRLDVALAADLGGIHLPSNQPAADAFRRAAPRKIQIGRSCHTLEEARRAAASGADFIVFGPVFDTASKRVYGSPVGVQALREVCQAVEVPVLALGGVTLANAADCLEAGASGLAGIGLFQESGDLEEVIGTLRALEQTGDAR